MRIGKPGGITNMNFTGDFRYTRSFGTRTLNETQSPEPFDQDTVLLMASCAKLVTSVAVLQCVERGLLQLDSNIGEVLSDLHKPLIASINEKGEVELKSAKNPITLRLVPVCCHSMVYVHN